VGLCLQAYLYRTEADIRRLAPLRPAIRLVKGAYAEPSTLAFPKKRDVDNNYLKCAALLLDGSKRDGIWTVFGTHDKQILLRIQTEAKRAGISNNSFEFHLLYGIKPEEQRRLLQDGNQVRVLISYGTYWFPWYMRRLAERPANVLFVLRNLFG
jgi:proline dehydrogenase